MPAPYAAYGDVACAASPHSVIRPFDHCFSGFRSRSTQRCTLPGSVAATSPGSGAGKSAASAVAAALRSAGAGASGSVAVRTHHWWPSRPLFRIDVQLPWVVRLCDTMHVFGTVPSTSAKVKPPKMCSRCSRLGSSPHRVRRTRESMPSAPISTSCSAVLPSAKCRVTARSSCSMRSTCWLNRMTPSGIAASIRS